MRVLPWIDWAALTLFFAVWAAYARFAHVRAAVQPSLLAMTNRINVTAFIAKGTEAGTNPVVFKFTRSGNLNPLTVGYTTGGTATSGTDYTPPSGIVIFPMGVNTSCRWYRGALRNPHS